MYRFVLLAALSMLSALASAAPNWPDLSIPAAPQFNSGKDVAVIVGIENYAELPTISGAVDNAEAWYLYFTVTLGLPEERVSLLTNKKGTREKLLKAFQEKTRLAQKGGNLWFIFVGHGAPPVSKNGGLLLGYDTQSEIDSIEERSVSVQEVLDIVKKGKQTKTIALLDTGLNGHIPEGELVFGIEHDHSIKKIGIKDLAATFKKKSKQELTLMTGAAGEQYSGTLPGTTLPAFSYLALGAVRGWADADEDGVVTSQELRDYTASILLVLASDQLQTPALAASNVESMIALSIENGPDLNQVFASLSGSAKPVKPIVSSAPPKAPPIETPKPLTDSTSKLGGAKPGREAIEAFILQKINAARTKKGLKPLTQESRLLAAARDHSQEMAELNYFSHNSPTPGLENFIDRITAAGAKGFSTGGENIVFRQQEMSDAEMAEALFQQWMDSPGHKENILTEEFLVTGLGVFLSGSRCWATQVFVDQLKK
jgi:uncharacterized protein YkwD